MDTDSLVYLVEKGSAENNRRLETGHKFGDFKDEVEDTYGSGTKVTKFYTSGAKSYVFEVEPPNKEKKQVMKIKGNILTFIVC